MAVEYFSIDWQTAVALLIVSAAIAVFAWKIVGSIFVSTSGCGSSCGNCPAASESGAAVKVIELVQIDKTKK